MNTNKKLLSMLLSNSEAFPKQDGGNDKASEQTEKPSETSNIEKELKQELAKINEDLLNTKTKCQDFEVKELYIRCVVRKADC